MLKASSISTSRGTVYICHSTCLKSQIKWVCDETVIMWLEKGHLPFCFMMTSKTLFTLNWQAIYPEMTPNASRVITHCSTGSLLPELVSTLRGLLEEVSAAVPLGVFWAAVAAAANAARFCSCIAFSPATHWRMHSFSYNSHHHPSLTDPATSAHHKRVTGRSLKTTGLILITDLFYIAIPSYN